MPLTRSKFAVGDQVEFEGQPAKVVALGGGKVAIRKATGYVEHVRPGALKKLKGKRG